MDNRQLGMELVEQLQAMALAQQVGQGTQASAVQAHQVGTHLLEHQY